MKNFEGYLDLDEEETQELLSDNYKGVIKKISEMNSNLHNSIEKLSQISDVITYKGDGNTLTSIKMKIERAIRQLGNFEIRIKFYKEELVVPWKRIKK